MTKQKIFNKKQKKTLQKKVYTAFSDSISLLAVFNREFTESLLLGETFSISIGKRVGPNRRSSITPYYFL